MITMKKITYFLAIGVIAATAVFYGCKKKEDPAPVETCESMTFPTNTGSTSIEVLNYGNTISVNAGDVLSIAIQITKVNDRPQKLRLYTTDCANKVGDIVTLTGQPGAEDNDTRLDLRNTDDPQIKQVLYTVPTGMSTIYLNIEVDENNNKYSYKRLTLNVSGSGIIDSWANVSLGGNSSNTASRMSSGTGQTYDKCNAVANMDYIDITYAVNTTNPYPSYLCSNPARFLTPVSLGTSTADCGEDGNGLSTAGGSATYFLLNNTANFDTATDADLTALTVSSSSPQYVQISAVGTVYEFLNSKGKKGLIKVVSGTLNNTTTDIVVSVKVQR
jgi:hypothetical protein